MPSDRPWLAHYPERVPRSLTYRSIPIYQLLAESVARHPDLPAIRFYQTRLTYQQLWDQAQRSSAVFASLGIGRGDRIALMLPNCPQYVIAYYGALLAGAIVVQVNPLYTARELGHLLSNSGAETIVVADALYPVVQAVEGTPLKRVLVTRLRGGATLGPEAESFEKLLAAAPATPPEVEVDAQDVAVLQYTGGTTGVSKGAMLTHFNIVANVAQSAALNPDALPPGEARCLTVIPLFHVYGMTVCMNLTLAQGGEVILLPRFDLAEVMETIKATQPTHFPGVPTMYVAVNGFPNAESYGLSSIKYLNSGAAPMPVEVMSEYEARFGGKILEGYGLSEASPTTHAHPPLAVRKPGTVGLPLPDTDCEIVDLDLGTKILPVGEVGEIRIKGPQVMRGYWGMPKETAIALRDGWLYTGDIGKMDADGYFSIVDRKKDMIIASGYNVYPRDVEEVLYEHPAIRECCVAGVPDRYRGETVKAYIVLRSGVEISVDDLRAFCRERLAAYKIPKIIEFRDSLPKSLVGKILRRVLVDADKAAISL